MGNSSSSMLQPMAQVDYASYTGVRFSKEVPNSEEPNRGPIHITEIMPMPTKESTLWHNFLEGVQVDNGTRDCFGTRRIDPVTGKAGDFEWQTYGQVFKRVEHLASGMQQMLALQRQSIVGVFCKNRMEWCLVEHACNRMAYVLVPLYDTLGPDAVPFIVNHTDMKVLFCGMDQFRTVMDCQESCPTLQTVVQFEDVTDEQRQLAQSKQIMLLSLRELEAFGAENHVPEDPPTPQDISTLCYTSGTTGNPKGVILLHKNIACVAMFGRFKLDAGKDDVHLSYLPLPHVFERAVVSVLIRAGAAIGFYQGDVALLMDDLAALKPTLFPSVPRLFNRVYDKILQGVNAAGGVKKLLFDRALAAKKQGLQDGFATHALWDALVFSKIRMVLGGRVHTIVSGSAPLSAEVKDFLKVVFCCTVVEGYGLSETAAVSTVASSEMPLGPHCGTPAFNVQIRLEDVPEMNYTSNDRPRPRGEVLIRGDTVFAGYYKDPEKTAEVFDQDGWFHTGDIGCWNADGTLSIIDRKKNIFKLSQGEYVAPEKIENVYLKSQYVAQVFVYGDSFQNTLVAIVVPDPEVAESWAKEHGKSSKNSLEKLCGDPEFKETVAKSMAQVAQMAQLRGFEVIKKFHLMPEPFSMENGLITPTFKLKRPQLKAYFKTSIEQMYQAINAEAAMASTN